MPRKKPVKTDDTTLQKSMADEGGAERHPSAQAAPPEVSDAELWDIPAPRSEPKKEKDSPDDKPEPEKKLTAEEKKKAAEAEKKERSRQKFLKEHPTAIKGVGLLAKGAFGVGAVIAKEKLWNLTDEEADAIGKAWEPVLAIYGPEWLLKIMPVLGAVVVTGQICAKKASDVAAKKEAEKDAKHAAVKAEAEQITKDLEAAAARMKQEREALDVVRGKAEAEGSGKGLPAEAA